jgi:hypothetical protein
VVTVRRSRFELVPADDPRLEGRLVKESVEGDTFVIYFAKGAMTEELCEQINTYLDLIATQTGWPADWGNAPDGQQVTYCVFVFVSAAALPDGRFAHPVFNGGECVWQILEGEMTKACQAALNEIVGRAVSEGLTVRP